MSLLDVRSLSVHYGAICALHDVSFELQPGEIVTLIGANGAGKSTILRTISGLVQPSAGSIEFSGTLLTGRPAHKIAALGVAHVPEGRRPFANLTVRENLRLGAFQVAERKAIDEAQERVFRSFPRLKERINQSAGTLSGGELQMLAMGRALMARPKLLLLDEPSMGLSPILVREIFSIIEEINNQGTAILLVEQNAFMALNIAGRAYVLETGRVVLAGAAATLRNDPKVKAAYLGEATEPSDPTSEEVPRMSRIMTSSCPEMCRLQPSPRLPTDSMSLRSSQAQGGLTMLPMLERIYIVPSACAMCGANLYARTEEINLSIMRCTSCGFDISTTIETVTKHAARFCWRCGEALSQPANRCTSCGEDLTLSEKERCENLSEKCRHDGKPLESLAWLSKAEAMTSAPYELFYLCGQVSAMYLEAYGSVEEIGKHQGAASDFVRALKRQVAAFDALPRQMQELVISRPGAPSVDSIRAWLAQNEEGKHMISENDIKVGMALLAEVAQKMHAELGALAAVAAGVEYDAKIDTLCDELLRQCSTAEKKLGEYRPGLAYAAFLGGRLLAVQAKPGGTISTRGKAIQSYERAIELGHDEALTRYYLGLLHSANYKVVGGHKDKAIENLQRVVDMKGIDSELGMESAKEIEKLTAKKSGCFIATAAYGSPQAEQVGVLCEFRDRVLSLSLLGRCFIRFYYWASPPIASYVGSRDRLRRAARNILVGPALKLARRCLRVIEAVPSNAERR